MTEVLNHWRCSFALVVALSWMLQQAESAEPDGELPKSSAEQLSRLSTDFDGQGAVSAQLARFLPALRPQSSEGSFAAAFVSLNHLNQPTIQPVRGHLGAQSCAAASCHGGPRPGVANEFAERGNEYAIWLENDPHARSWRTFCSDESVTMMRRLGILSKTGEVLDAAGYDNCLACHNTTQRYGATMDHGLALSPHRAMTMTSASRHSSGANSFAREGVACSACHGPSAHWAGQHIQYGWDRKNSGHLGFVNLASPLARARACASCHVGDRDRDMNHDIIAAGHPALHYEHATYHNRLPKHWREETFRAHRFDEASLWLAGQVAAADAQLSLIGKRAASKTLAKDSVSKWPSLASYDCASCHHDFGFGLQSTALGKRKAA